MEIITSKDYLLYIDTETATSTNLRPPTQDNYRLVACWVSNGLSITNAAKEFTNKCSGGNSESAPGTTSSTMTGNGHAYGLSEDEAEAQSNYQEIMDLANGADDDTGKKKVFFAKIHRPAINGMGEVYREAKVWISDYSEAGENEDPLTFDATFTVTGRLFTTPLPITP